MLDFVLDDLKKSIIDFHNVVGSTVCLFDETGNELFAYPENTTFCSNIKSIEPLSKKCTQCDKNGFNTCSKSKKPYIYTCHMGLTEVMVSIWENDILIGYLMFGQILCNYDKNSIVQRIDQVCDDYNLSKQMMLDAFADIKKLDKKFVSSAANLMTMCVCYLYINNIIKVKNEVIEYQFKEYISNNLFSELSVTAVCQKFFLSKSKLYNLSLKVYGKGLGDYILDKRLEEAKNQLAYTKKKISQIALNVGFNDANYFSRAFKRHIGVTPQEYRITKTQSN